MALITNIEMRAPMSPDTSPATLFKSFSKLSAIEPGRCSLVQQEQDRSDNYYPLSQSLTRKTRKSALMMSRLILALIIIACMGPCVMGDISVCSLQITGEFTTTSGAPCTCTPGCEACAVTSISANAVAGGVIGSGCITCMPSYALYLEQCYASCDTVAGFSTLSFSGTTVCWPPLKQLAQRFNGTHQGVPPVRRCNI